MSLITTKTENKIKKFSKNAVVVTLDNASCLPECEAKDHVVYAHAALIRPVMKYGTVTWDPYTKKDMASI